MFDQAEDGRYLLTADQIGELQASEFRIGQQAGRAEMRAVATVVVGTLNGRAEEPLDAELNRTTWRGANLAAARLVNFMFTGRGCRC